MPTGLVSFYSGKKLLGTVALNLNGVAVLTLPSMGGPQSITAVYTGDDNYAPITSTAITTGSRLV